MRSRSGLKEPVYLWIWLGNALSTLTAAAMLAYPRFEKVGRHMTLTLRGGGLIMLGLVAISFFVSYFGTRWDDLLSWERALVLSSVWAGLVALALAVVALLIWLLKESGDPGALGDFGFGDGFDKADSTHRTRRRRRLREPGE